MKHKFCKSHDKITKIKLMTDYCSDHIWCGICGIGLSIDDLEIPNYIRVMVHLWGNLWDVMTSCDTGFDEDWYKSKYTETGEVIRRLLSQFFECEFANHIEMDFKLRNERN